MDQVTSVLQRAMATSSITSVVDAPRILSSQQGDPLRHALGPAKRLERQVAVVQVGD